MRPIEFRAWDKEVKEMNHNPSILAMWRDRPINEQFRLEAEEKLIWMQYTGLRDKNGNKIFEGDIVAPSGYVSEINKPGIVKWCDKKLCFYVDSIETPIYSAGYKMYFGFDNAIEIRGNIHENKDLLEVAEE